MFWAGMGGFGITVGASTAPCHVSGLAPMGKAQCSFLLLPPCQVNPPKKSLWSPSEAPPAGSPSLGHPRVSWVLSQYLFYFFLAAPLQKWEASVEASPALLSTVGFWELVSGPEALLGFERAVGSVCSKRALF